jgi:hypothetical protein
MLGDFIKIDGRKGQKAELLAKIYYFVYLKGMEIFAANAGKDSVFFSSMLDVFGQSVALVDDINGGTSWRKNVLDFLPFINSIVCSCYGEPIDYSYFIPEVVKNKAYLSETCEKFKVEITKMLSVSEWDRDKIFLDAKSIFMRIKDI